MAIFDLGLQKEFGFWVPIFFGCLGFLVNDTWAKWGLEIWPL